MGADGRQSLKNGPPGGATLDPFSGGKVTVKIVTLPPATVTLPPAQRPPQGPKKGAKGVKKKHGLATAAESSSYSKLLPS